MCSTVLAWYTVISCEDTRSFNPNPNPLNQLARPHVGPDRLLRLRLPRLRPHTHPPPPPPPPPPRPTTTTANHAPGHPLSPTRPRASVTGPSPAPSQRASRAPPAASSKRVTPPHTTRTHKRTQGSRRGCCSLTYLKQLQEALERGVLLNITYDGYTYRSTCRKRWSEAYSR